MRIADSSAAGCGGGRCLGGAKAGSGAWVALLAGVLVTVGVGAWAAAPPAEPHGHGAHALKLNAGQKWATDEPLRQGMSRIRAVLESAPAPGQHPEPGAAQYDALGKEIEAQLVFIVQNCKLEPQADAMLHVILADLTAGADTLQGKLARVKPSAGVRKVTDALARYGKYFDHPGWNAAGRTR